MVLDRRARLLAAAVASAADMAAAPTAQPVDVEVKTVAYASRGGTELLLDLYLPQGAQGRLPVIVFLHGGGWSGGTRTMGPDFRRFFARDGFAMAAIEYRLTPSVLFPANVEDVKTAVRWLRANAATYGLDADRIGLWGTSAGGHLAAVAGLSPRGVFEGTGDLDQSSAVQCVLDAYGPAAFHLMDAQTEAERATLHPLPPALAQAPTMRPPTTRHDEATSPESRLVGAPIQTVPDRVRAASPLTYVTSGAPPFLIMHGLADSSVPHHQSVLLHESLVAAGNDATLRLVDGLPHMFFNRTNLDGLAGPFRMDVRAHPRGGPAGTRVERRGVFDVAREFFRAHLMRSQ